MTAEIINLRQFRKQRARDEKAKEAAENRVRFGRTRAERELEALTQARAEVTLDGHAREANSAITSGETAAAPEEDVAESLTSAPTSPPKPSP